MSALTLPGSIPGLLRRGSPVVMSDDFPGVVIEIMDSQAGPMAGAEVGYFHKDPKKRGTMAWTVRSLGLDLTDATGRAHAAWWLAGHEFGAPDARPDLTVFRRRGNGWELTSYDEAHHPQSWTDADLGLDPDCPRLLPDGSRWVDAEALRLAVLHVSGLVP